MGTTVFSTRCWPGKRRLELAGLLLCAVLCWLVPAAAQAQAVTEISQLRVERGEEGLLLSANVQFELPGVVDDALLRGIPMSFVAEATLLRDRWYWTDKHVTSATRHMRLSYQPLTRRWRLITSPTPIAGLGLSLGQSFDSREEALAALQRITRWKIAEAGDVEADARHNVEFRFRLDVSQLPRPFQIGAVGQSDWTITASRNVRLAVETAR